MEIPAHNKDGFNKYSFITVNNLSTNYKYILFVQIYVTVHLSSDHPKACQLGADIHVTDSKSLPNNSAMIVVASQLFTLFRKEVRSFDFVFGAYYNIHVILHLINYLLSINSLEEKEL